MYKVLSSEGSSPTRKEFLQLLKRKKITHIVTAISSHDDGSQPVTLPSTSLVVFKTSRTREKVDKIDRDDLAITTGPLNCTVHPIIPALLLNNRLMTALNICLGKLGFDANIVWITRASSNS